MDHSFLFPGLVVWVSLWMWSLGGNQQPFSCVLGYLRYGDEQTNKQTTNQVILEQACSWPVRRQSFVPELRPWMAWRVLASSGSPGSRFVHLHFLVKARPRSNPLSRSRANSFLLTKFSSSSRSCRSKSSVGRLPSSDGPQSSVEQAFRCARKSYQKFDPFSSALLWLS